MVHLPEEELSDWLDEASSKVKVGGFYKHYKSVNNTYKVTGLAIVEATNAPAVIYQAQYGRQITFVRPLKEWLETVEYGERTLPRFTEVSQG